MKTQHQTEGETIALANNLTSGAHPTGRLTRTAGEAITEGQLLNIDSEGTVGVAAANEDALYIAEDDAASGDPVPVAVLGSAPGTLVGLAGGTIAEGDIVVGAAGGELVELPTAAGTYKVYGRAVKASADGLPVEIAHQLPADVVVTE
jgi:hypothetical protein